MIRSFVAVLAGCVAAQCAGVWLAAAPYLSFALGASVMLMILVDWGDPLEEHTP